MAKSAVEATSLDESTLRSRIREGRKDTLKEAITAMLHSKC